MHTNFISILVIFSLLCVTCKSEPKNSISKEKLEEMLINEQSAFLRREAQYIDHFVSETGWKMTTTGTGLRIYIYEPGYGVQAVNGSTVEIEYELKLLDGTFCNGTKAGESFSFKVGSSNVESGLHEAMTYMRAGDRAKLIMPAHLGHGLSGDFKNIPPQSPLLFDVKLLRVE